jgi:hypothetical protein
LQIFVLDHLWRFVPILSQDTVKSHTLQSKKKVENSTDDAQFKDVLHSNYLEWDQCQGVGVYDMNSDAWTQWSFFIFCAKNRLNLQFKT